MLQLGSLCWELLLHIPTKGYDVCGERILGSRCLCSGALVCASLYICDVTISPEVFFRRLHALCGEILVSEACIHLLVGQLVGQHSGAM